MSLTSKQIAELRAYAKDRKGELAKLINDAADTIETLSTRQKADIEVAKREAYGRGYEQGKERYRAKLTNVRHGKRLAWSA